MCLLLRQAVVVLYQDTVPFQALSQAVLREGERDQVKNAPGLIIYIHKVSTKVWV